MICSDAVLVRLEVGDELHELVGLPVEVEPVQRLQRERRVAHPGVAVVPVALAARRLRQRGRERGDRRAGRHVGEALDRERRALDRVAPAVVGDARPAEPARARSAIVARDPRLGLVDVAGRGELLGPRERAVALARPPSSTCRARTRSPSMPSARSVLQPDRLARAGRVGGVPAAVDERPLGRRRGRSRRRARRRARSRRCPSRHSTVRTSMWSASSSAGGRVCGVTVVLAGRAGPSSARRGRRPSRTASSRSSRARSCPARRRARSDG